MDDKANQIYDVSIASDKLLTQLHPSFTCP